MNEAEKEIKKFDSETGGERNKIDTTIISKEPMVLSFEYLNKYLESFNKEKKYFKKTIEDVRRLDIDAKRIEEKFKELKEDQNKSNNFMMWGTGIIVGVFFITGIIISIDYFFNRGNDNKYFINQVNLTKQDFYSKDELKYLIDENNKNTKTLNCLEISRWLNPKCFEN